MTEPAEGGVKEGNPAVVEEKKELNAGLGGKEVSSAWSWSITKRIPLPKKGGLSKRLWKGTKIRKKGVTDKLRKRGKGAPPSRKISTEKGKSGKGEEEDPERR